MVVGLLIMDIHVPESGSLKSKRFVIKSLKDRIRAKFNVSVAEDANDLWQRVTIYVATLANDPRLVNSALENVKNMVEKEHDIEILDYSMEID